MGKRSIIGLFAAMSVIAIWWTDAGAATCLQYRTIGGSSVCSKWSTKGVLLELTYKQPCGPDEGARGDQGRLAVPSRRPSQTIVLPFVRIPRTRAVSPVTKVRCTESVTFFGAEEGCDPKHDEDGTGTGGAGTTRASINVPPRSSSSGWVAATLLALAGLGPALDVTPITMQTNVAVTVVPGEGGEEGASSPCTLTGEEDTSCTFTELCSINPSKIEFNAIRPYQCTLTSAGGPPPTPPLD